MPDHSRGRSSDIKEHYSKWLTNRDLVEKLKTKIEKVGYPLEIAARQILSDNGYTYRDGQYYSQLNQDGSEILREVDINASKDSPHEVDLNGCTFLFWTNIIGECKYSSTNDFFVFESEEGLSGWNFPIMLKRDRFVTYSGRPTFADLFKFPNVIQSIAEVDVNAQNFHPSNRVVFEAASQITNAIAYFAEMRDEDAEELYGDEYDESKRIIEEHDRLSQKLSQTLLAKKNRSEWRNEDYKSIRMAIAEKIFRRIGVFAVNLSIPIIVVGKNNGIIKVIMEDDKVVDLQEMKYCLYNFTPSVVPKYFRRVYPIRHQIPIVICNINWLDECIKFLDGNISKCYDLIMQKVRNDPEQVYAIFADYVREYGRKNST